jgi:hypothetical protein
MEREAQQLLKLTDEERKADPRDEGIWGEVKTVATDMYQGVKAVLSDLGLTPAGVAELALGFL